MYSTLLLWLVTGFASGVASLLIVSDAFLESADSLAVSSSLVSIIFSSIDFSTSSSLVASFETGVEGFLVAEISLLTASGTGLSLIVVVLAVSVAAVIKGVDTWDVAVATELSSASDESSPSSPSVESELVLVV